jgi:hypothetical protein
VEHVRQGRPKHSGTRTAYTDTRLSEGDDPGERKHELSSSYLLVFADLRPLLRGPRMAGSCSDADLRTTGDRKWTRKHVLGPVDYGPAAGRYPLGARCGVPTAWCILFQHGKRYQVRRSSTGLLRPSPRRRLERERPADSQRRGRRRKGRCRRSQHSQRRGPRA